MSVPRQRQSFKPTTAIFTKRKLSIDYCTRVERKPSFYQGQQKFSPWRDREKIGRDYEIIAPYLCTNEDLIANENPFANDEEILSSGEEGGVRPEKKLKLKLKVMKSRETTPEKVAANAGILLQMNKPLTKYVMCKTPPSRSDPVKKQKRSLTAVLP